MDVGLGRAREMGALYGGAQMSRTEQIEINAHGKLTEAAI